MDSEDSQSWSLAGRVVDLNRLQHLIKDNEDKTTPLDLRGAVLNGRFEGLAFPPGTLLAEADLTSAHLHKAKLPKADLTNADLTAVNLSEADLRGAIFVSADLPRANLWKCRLENADFTDADLQGANLEGTTIGDAIFDNANLQNANLEATNASPRRAYFRNANLQGANLEDAYLAHSDLSDANLQNANLESANLSYADLTDSNILYANIERATLDSVTLENTTLYAVNWGPRGEEGIKDQPPETAEAIYRKLKIWYQGAGLYSAGGEYFRKEMDARRRGKWRKKRLRSFIWLLIWHLLAGYGERPQLVLLWMLVLVIGPTLFYFWFSALPYAPHNIVSALYFSSVSTVALGYGAWVEDGVKLWAQAVGVSQTFLGAFLLALLLVTVVRKMTR